MTLIRIHHFVIDNFYSSKSNTLILILGFSDGCFHLYITLTTISKFVKLENALMGINTWLIQGEIRFQSTVK
jgi:hypothetical protein